MARPKLIVLLSGQVCTGKTTLAKRLSDGYNFQRLSTGDLLRSLHPEVPSERRAMQELGEALDRKTKGRWVREALTIFLDSNNSDGNSVIVDAVRAASQIEEIRKAYGAAVVHVHLDCNKTTLAERYRDRPQGTIKELSAYGKVQENATEAEVHKLWREADICIQTDRCNEDDVVVRVACHLGLHGREYPAHVDVIVGGQYGSEGKGQVAAYLAKEYSLLVRVGGPNAGHKVWEVPEPFTFHQLPSGTRAAPETRLLIGPGAALNVSDLLTEIGKCNVDHERLSIDPRAIIIQPQDIKIEQRTIEKTIGSTARGVGEACVRRVRRRGKTKFAEHIAELKPFIRPALDVLEEARINRQKVMLEGTQGTGLSLFHGRYPHVTSRDTTVAGCLSEAGIPPRSLRRVVMVCRTYPIRVKSPATGDSGPMGDGKEISLQEVSKRSGVLLADLQRTEITSTTGRPRRIAEFDWMQLRRSASLNAPTDIALTFADYLDKKNRHARRFDQLAPETILFVEEVERITGADVSLISTRFHSRAIIDRRNW